MQRQPFDKNWRFHLGDPEGAPWRELDDSNWRQVDLPHDWSIELDRQPDAPSIASGGYFPMGRGWYRKTFTAPDDWRDRQVFIEFEGVYMNAEVWLNRNFLGRHPYGYTTFRYDLTPYLAIGGENVLTVKVDNDTQLNSRWYSGSGIYRHVCLQIGGPVRVTPWGLYVTTPSVTDDAAEVAVETTIANDGESDQTVTVHAHVLTPEGAVIGSAETSLVIEAGTKRTARQQIQVAEPRRWSPQTPQLYRLEAEITVGETLVDTATTSFGIRTLVFDAERGFLLNDKETKLRGGCVHHDNGVLGAAAYDRSEARKVELLKANGYNAIRCAHNPPSPAFLNACDRLGMLVIDEAFDCWREGKTPYDYHVAFADWWDRDIESMVLRDRNHPSIIMWSIGNEVRERNGRSQGATIAQQLAGRIRELDPGPNAGDGRAITAGINGGGNAWPWEETDAVFDALDVGGYNYQERQYRPDHKRHPDRIMYASESTAGEALEHWHSVLELPYVIGDFVWTSLDYLGEAGIGRVHFNPSTKSFLGDYPWHQANCGDLDLCGFKRPQSYYRDILWGTGSKLYIAVHDPLPPDQEPIITYWGWPLVSADWTWPGREGETFQVDVYSGCEQVELTLNGRSLGVRPTGQDTRYIATFDVPYDAGSLTATGYDGDEPVAKWELHTVEAPVGLRLTADRSEIRADGQDLSFITVEIVDRLGRVHPKADAEIYFTVQGTGTIAAVGNGDPTSKERYRGNQRSAHQGRCLVVVRATDTPGDIRLRAQADGLDEADLTLSTVA